jgi:hypothetical protein
VAIFQSPRLFVAFSRSSAFSFRVSRHGSESKHPLFMRIVSIFAGHENRIRKT